MIGIVWMGLVGVAAAESPVTTVLIEAVRKANPRYVEGPEETCVAMVQIRDGAARRVSVTGCSWPRAVEAFRALEGWSWSERGVSEPLSNGRTRVPMRFGATPGWVALAGTDAAESTTVFESDGRVLTWGRELPWEQVLDVDMEPRQLAGQCSFSVDVDVTPRGECPGPLVAFAGSWRARAGLEGIDTWTVLTELPATAD